MKMKEFGPQKEEGFPGLKLKSPKNPIQLQKDNTRLWH